MGSSLDIRESPSVDVLASAYLQSNAFLVHRLDMATSGLMCIAKSRDMAKYVSQCLLNRQLTKQY